MADDILRSMRQASTIYNIDGASPPRMRNLFFVRFRYSENGSTNQPQNQSSGGTSANTPGTSKIKDSNSTVGNGWKRSLGFLVKTADRPTVSPVVEEINQYNKKRQIHTGYKLAPIRLTIYDTADNMAMQMWNDYSTYYFGDFSQTDQYYRYDVTTQSMLDAGSGFGYVPRSDSQNASSDINSQFFFDALEIYEVYGNSFVRTDLINPKIVAFDPDELDYESSQASMITMQLTYEAILQFNGGKPVAISSDPVVSEAFSNPELLNGDPLELPAGTSTLNSTVAYPPSVVDTYYPPVSLPQPPVQPVTFPPANTRPPAVGTALSAYGDYNFGNRNGLTNSTYAFGADLAYSANQNPTVGVLLDLPNGQSTVNDLLARGNYDRNTRGVNAASYETTHAQIRAQGGSRQEATDFAAGAMVTASVLGGAPTDHIRRNHNGLLMSAPAYGVVNSGRKPISQIGFNGNFPTNK